MPRSHPWCVGGSLLCGVCGFGFCFHRNWLWQAGKTSCSFRSCWSEICLPARSPNWVFALYACRLLAALCEVRSPLAVAMSCAFSMGFLKNSLTMACASDYAMGPCSSGSRSESSTQSRSHSSNSCAAWVASSVLCANPNGFLCAKAGAGSFTISCKQLAIATPCEAAMCGLLYIFKLH